MAFEQRQQQYFTQELNRALPSSTDANTLELALGNIDPTVNGQQILDTRGFLSDFGINGGAMKRDAECRAIPYPSPAMRAPDARVGCGWWFSQNPAVPSTGAYGARRGPMNPNLEGPGKWIWDPKEAAKLEGQKTSARFRTCPDIQYSPNPNIGWCPSTGRALMTDGGKPAYPQMAGGDCPGEIIMNAANCPAPARSGTGTGMTDLCTPINGKLSPACLQSLASWSCSSNGLLATSLGSGYAGTSDTFNATNKYLLQRGFTLHAGIVNDGRLTVQDALNSVKGLKSMADGSQASGAAMKMCYGTPFDPCALKPTDKGPYDPQCITQKALSMGYSPAGKLLPSNIGMGYWNQAPTWQNVIEYLTWWKNVADLGPSFAGQNVSIQLQLGGIDNVYGISVPDPTLCKR
jgi:hypothetical protein